MTMGEGHGVGLRDTTTPLICWQTDV